LSETAGGKKGTIKKGNNKKFEVEQDHGSKGTSEVGSRRDEEHEQWKEEPERARQLVGDVVEFFFF
jgi:hypothetical protein